MKSLVRIVFKLVVLGLVQVGYSAVPTVSYDGRTLSLTVENQSFGQVMSLLQQKTGLQFEIPGDLQGLRLPLVEIRSLSVREALLKLLQGSNYDYILIAAPGNSDQVQKLLVPGRSTKVSGAPSAFRATNHPAAEDPFGGSAEATFDDNSNVQSEPPAINAQPAQNPPAQAVQPGVQPVPVNANQTVVPGGNVQQPQAQPQGLQPFNPFGNQNNRRAPY